MSLIPLSSSHLTGIDRRDVLHAVATRHVIAKLRRSTRDAVCGERCKAYAVTNAAAEPGAFNRHVVMPWPPPQRTEAGRCPDCWAATGRKRPDAMWRLPEPKPSP